MKNHSTIPLQRCAGSPDTARHRRRHFPRTLATTRKPPVSVSIGSVLQFCVVTSLLVMFSGCSLFVIAGKAVLGDPKVSAPFTTATGEDLTKSDDRVAIICTVPHRILSEFPSIQVDIVDRVSQNLDGQNVNVVRAGDVSSWYDDHGEWGDFSGLAQEFDARFIVQIDIREFDYRVPSSENLLQGRAEGHISVHEYSDTETKISRHAGPVTLAFDRDFALTFPETYPIPRESRSQEQFVLGFTDRLAQHLSQHLYDYHQRDAVR